MVVALGASGQWNIDQSRHARESLPPADYLRWSYYRIWLEAVKEDVGKSEKKEYRLYFRGQNLMLIEPLRLEGTK